MNDRWYVHLIWLTWLILLTSHVLKETGVIQIRTATQEIAAYEPAQFIKTSDPYLVVPLYAAKKDVRSRYYMKMVDRMFQNV